ncbi:MAG: insulinase family protein [Deltaproteobacteria bacterium]|nr:insulinase family protein [Deltaproteobacteria bacterium]
MKNLLFALLFLSLSASVHSIVDARLTPQRSVLEDGLVLLTSEERALPIVTFNLLIKAGSRYDPQGRQGLANLTARLLSYGTSSRTALQISETLDFIGAGLSTGCGEELATVNLTLLKKDLDVGLNLLAEILTASVFPQEEIDRQKQSVIASIRAREEEPGAVAQTKFFEALFPQSPYGRPVEGTVASVQGVDRADIAEFYKQYYRPDRAILAVVGDISHQDMMERLAQAFRSWEGKASAQEPRPSVSPGPANFIRIDKNLTQANIVIGHEGVPRGHPDYYAIQVMNYILGGGGFSSRLMDSVRNERGLAYSVYSLFDADKYVGTFQVTMQTKNESAEEAIRTAMEEIRRIREKGVSGEELQAAKDYLIGSFPLRFDTNRRLASFFTQVEFFELGLDYPERYSELIRTVRREDVLRVAQRYLQPEKLIVVMVANQEKTGLKR